MSRLRQIVRERLDTVPAAHRPRPLPAGIAAVTLLVLLLAWGFTQKVPFVDTEGGRFVRAEVASADAVADRTPVRVGGVKVGRVDHLEPGPRRSDGTSRTSIVVMRITDDRIVVKRDAAAHVRWRTLLGSMYVDLDPGSPSASPLGDRVIPLRRTGIQVDWDDFTGQFPTRTRQAQRHAIAEFRRALSAPRAHGRTLRELGPALSVIGRGADALRGRRHGDLRRLLQTTATTVDALSRDRAALERFVDGANRTLAATAHRRRALGQTVQLSPRALRSSTATMHRLVATLDHLDPLVARLRPGARRLGTTTRALQPALVEVDRVLRHARPLLRAAKPAFAGLGAAGEQGTPLIRGLRPTVRRLQDELLPYLRRRDSDIRLRVYQTIGPFFAVLAGAAGEFDASGNWLHFATGPAPNSALLPCDPGLRLEAVRRCTALTDVLDTLLGGKRR